jgi:hypothetical protein
MSEVEKCECGGRTRRFNDGPRLCWDCKVAGRKLSESEMASVRRGLVQAMYDPTPRSP